MFDQLVKFVRDTYKTNDFIPLHAPVFSGNEHLFVADTITSTFVSSVGSYVERFENDMAKFTGAERAVAVVNGTAALHLALLLAGVRRDDLVLTQPVSFIASCNAIHYCGAKPVFLDVDRARMSLSPKATEEWLDKYAFLDDDHTCRHRFTGQTIRAALPMHTFGHPADLDGLKRICAEWNLTLVEDAAESVGSSYRGKHTGTFGKLGAFSFNGNKIMTTGGGGMIITDSETAATAKHLSTTAKRPHAFEYEHDQLGYNYRMPNLNAALGSAQLENLTRFVEIKRNLAISYAKFFADHPLHFVSEPDDSKSNYWLNSIVCADRAQRDILLKETNQSGVMTRPIWGLMHRQPMYINCIRGPLDNAEWLADRVVNIPSSVDPNLMESSPDVARKRMI
jgi:aminotransferase in exopolysaccharide biosynthesis